MTAHDIPAIPALAGMWRRSLLALPDGRRDTGTLVTWRKGRRCSLICASRRAGRISRTPPRWPILPSPIAAGLPPSRASPACSSRRTACSGGIGRSTFSPPPRGPMPDGCSGKAKCWWRPAISPIIWNIGTPCPTPRRARADGRAAILVRGGNLFMFARERGAELALTDSTLGACVEGASALKTAQALVDCELSLGEANGWRGARCATRRVPRGSGRNGVGDFDGRR